MTTTQDNEIWKPIPGWEGYFASNQGRIKRVAFTAVDGKKISEHIVKPQLNKATGYMHINLYSSKDRKCHSHLLHRLIAKIFIDNPDNLEQINHKNEIKTDNRVENLEWCSRSYNIKYGSGYRMRIRSNCKTVLQKIPDTNRIIGIWGSVTQAANSLGVKQQNLSRAILDKKVHRGYIWVFA